MHRHMDVLTMVNLQEVLAMQLLIVFILVKILGHWVMLVLLPLMILNSQKRFVHLVIMVRVVNMFLNIKEKNSRMDEVQAAVLDVKLKIS